MYGGAWPCLHDGYLHFLEVPLSLCISNVCNHSYVSKGWMYDVTSELHLVCHCPVSSAGPSSRQSILQSTSCTKEKHYRTKAIKILN